MAIGTMLGAIAPGIVTGIVNMIAQGIRQRQTWNREDNAVSRRVEDLRRSGLSPTLAAGSAATTSAPIPTGVGSGLDRALKGVEAVRNLEQSRALHAQKGLLDMQANRVFNMMQHDVTRAQEEATYAKYKALMEKHNYLFFKNWNIPSAGLDSMSKRGFILKEIADQLKSISKIRRK